MKELKTEQRLSCMRERRKADPQTVQAPALARFPRCFLIAVVSASEGMMSLHLFRRGGGLSLFAARCRFHRAHVARRLSWNVCSCSGLLGSLLSGSAMKGLWNAERRSSTNQTPKLLLGRSCLLM